jgi:hypothetical protein
MMIKPWILFIACFVISCNNSSNQSPILSKDSPVYFPYAPVHSNEFGKGNEHHAGKVLDIWRQYETGYLRMNNQSLADSVRFILPDRILTGDKDSVLRWYQEKREGFSDMQCFVYSWLPIHKTDTREDLVYVWGLYDGTLKNGDRDYSMVHEIWRFDKKGRIKEMEQFRTHPH